jgi:asparagine synthase (glutamine-hydrolysing)
MQTIDVVFWLVKDILLKADKMSMASSVEVRVPFLDKEVYEVARKLSIENKLTKDLTKVSLRKAAQEVIPTEAYKKKKLGFPVPLREWIKTDYVFKKMQKAFNSKIAKELFDIKALNKLLIDTYKGEIDNYKKAWTVYTFLEWYNVYFN